MFRGSAHAANDAEHEEKGFAGAETHGHTTPSTHTHTWKYIHHTSSHTSRVHTVAQPCTLPCTAGKHRGTVYRAGCHICVTHILSHNAYALLPGKYASHITYVTGFQPNMRYVTHMRHAYAICDITPQRNDRAPFRQAKVGANPTETAIYHLSALTASGQALGRSIELRQVQDDGIGWPRLLLTLQLTARCTQINNITVYNNGKR